MNHRWTNHDLEETNKLIREVLIPQIIRLEVEVAHLRSNVWPYVQAKKETSCLDDMEDKIEFFKYLDEETLIELLNRKAKYSENAASMNREFHTIRKNCQFCKDLQYK